MDWGDKAVVGLLLFVGALIVTGVVCTFVDTGNQRECRVKAVTEQHVTADEAERICQ